MPQKVCRICLRSNITRTEDVDKIVEDFHEELCNINVFQNHLLTICSICEYLLIKFYNFKLKCQRSQKLIRKWNKKKIDFENLQTLILPSSLGLSPHNPTVYEFKSLDIKPVLKGSSLYLSEQAQKNFLTYVPLKDEINDSTFVEPVCQDLIYNDLCTENNGIDEDIQMEDQNDQEIKLNHLFHHTENHVVEIELKNDFSDSEAMPDNKMVQNKDEISSDDECLIKIKNNKLTEKSYPMTCTNLEKLKNRVLALMEQGEFKDLGSNITVDKEMFVCMIEKCNLTGLKEAKMMPGRQGPSEIPKIKRLLRYLYTRYHPKYEAVFNIEYLDTEIKKLAEFEARRHGREYLDAEYKCDICFKAFESESKLNYHNKWHESSQPHECDICQMRFRSRTTLTVHCRNNHCTVYRCKQCPVVTYNFGAMVNHYDHHKGVEYACPICLATFRNKSSMYTHRLLAHKTSHICPLCARSFVSDKGLYLHMKLKHREDSVSATISCEQCSAKLATPEILHKHVHEYHKRLKRNPHRCGECKQIFNSVEELKQHRVSQRHMTPARQRQRYAAGGKSGHRESRVNVFGPDKPSRTCPVCLVEVANTHHSALYKHYLAEHPQEPYTAHADKLEYLCEICGKGMRVHSLYLDHMNAHAGLRPYECTECEAKFPALHLLRAHQIRHRPPRYKCKDCGKLFLSAANLSCHRRTHIGDRRFKCDICFKGFLHRSSLNEHVRGVHHQIRRVKKTPRKENT